MPPPAAQGEEAGDGDPDRQRHVDQPEQVEEPGDRRDRRRPAGDHEPQPRVVDALDAGQDAVVGDQGEHYRGERRVPRRGGQDRFLFYPGHGAPRPHSARPSVFLMCSTSVARETKPTAPLTGIASSGDAPGTKLNR